MAVFPINSLQVVCDAHMEISFETYHTDDCKAGVPGPNKVRRYLCVPIKTLTSLGAFSQFPPCSSKERSLQAYSDSQAVVGFTYHEEEVVHILRLLYLVV